MGTRLSKKLGIYYQRKPERAVFSEKRFRLPSVIVEIVELLYRYG